MRRIRNKQSSAKNEAKAKVDNSRQTHSATLNEKENCFYFVFSFFSYLFLCILLSLSLIVFVLFFRVLCWLCVTICCRSLSPRFCFFFFFSAFCFALSLSLSSSLFAIRTHLVCKLPLAVYRFLAD